MDLFLAFIWLQNMLYIKPVFHSVLVWTVAQGGNHVANVKWNNIPTGSAAPKDWGAALPPFFSCTLYHLKQDPKGNYYMFLVFWVLSLKKYWKLIIKQDLRLEQIKCYVIKKTCELPGIAHWVIIQIRSSSSHPKSAKNFLRLLFSSSTAHLKYGLYAEN